LAILSRLPILSQRAIDLPADPRDGERAALAVEVGDRGRRILVVALHLTHLKDAGDLRRRQWEQVAAAAADSPTVLAAGDFNASAELLATTRRFEDCRRHLGQAPQPTLIGGGRDDCLDHIVFSRDGGLVPLHWRHALTAQALGQAASDHCAVVADFVAAPPTPQVQSAQETQT
jgi:endonuclease/exonuclease/phosphatase family metal-dependent hydrolase